jgi:catechol 2,3-dioxygenase-like lactoylglutathione lyase family enzyme
MNTVPRAFAHVGISVPDLEAAISWYEQVLGFRPIAPPREIVISDGGHVAELCTDMMGDELKHMKMAHLTTANGAALEMFEPIDPPYIAREGFEFWRGGPFHICVVDPDVDGLIATIEATGGRRRSGTWPLIEGRPYLAAYAEDPFGTVIEIYSHSHEVTFANHD